jgi:hypothetical protein
MVMKKKRGKDDEKKIELSSYAGFVPKIEDRGFMGRPRPSLVKGKKWILS